MSRRWRWVLPWMLGLTVLATGCDSKKEPPAPAVSVPASSDPEGDDLVEGAIVAAFEPDGGVRLYKIKKVKWFPKPVGDELVMIAFHEKGNDFVHAAKLFKQRDLTVIIPSIRVPKTSFMQRNYRVLDVEPVTDAERKLERDDPFPERGGPATPPPARSG